MAAAGEVTDYNAAVQADLTYRLALTLSLPAAAVSLQVTPASVRLLFTVQISFADLAVLIAKVVEAMPNAAAAASSLGVPVLSPPVSTAHDASIRLPPLLPRTSPPQLPFLLPPTLPLSPRHPGAFSTARSVNRDRHLAGGV